MSVDRRENAARAMGRLLKEEASKGFLADGEQRLRNATLRDDGFRVGPAHFSRHSPRPWLAAAMVVMALATAVLIWTRPSEPALSFQVAGQSRTARTSGRVAAPGEERLVRFSDGSRLRLTEGGSLRVRRTDSQGAEIVMEHGTLESSVHHDTETNWSVFAGPYEIVVIGTRFVTRWDPDQQSLVVTLEEGAVSILGSGIDGSVTVEAGQRFEALGRDAWKISSPVDPSPEPSKTKDSSPAAAAPPKQPTSQDATPSEQPAAPKGADQATAPAPSWSSLLALGHFGQVLEQAREKGLNECLKSCSATDVSALADAARYSGNIDVARRALQELRDRHPNHASRAAYLLGSLSEARGQAASALRWYSTYLQEAPGGQFVSEARAGRMRTLRSLGRDEDAKAAAKKYLRLHPHGVGQRIARQILDQ